MNTLDNLCPLDGRYRSSTEELRRVWGDCQLMRLRVYVELKWLEFFVANVHPKVPLTAEQQRDLEPLYEVTDENLERILEIEKETKHDVKAVEYYLRERVSRVCSLASYTELLHILLTSEDVNSVAYSLMTKRVLEKVLLPQMRAIVRRLQTLAAQHAATPLLARTHGQPASPTTFGKEFAVYSHRLSAHIRKLEEVKPLGKFSGAVGNFNAHVVAFPEEDWPKLAQQFVEGLGLGYQPLSTQIECHDWLAELCDCVARFNTTLIGLCQDCWAYISRDLLLLQHVESEVGSSTMPHKINPIDFENAEGNLGLSSAMLRFLSGKLPVSRLQRDLSDSTCLRSLGCSLGFGLLGFVSALKGLNKIRVYEEQTLKELDQHWELLAEPAQTLLRKWGQAAGYEQLKTLTRGVAVGPHSLKSFFAAAALPAAEKDKLLQLAPHTYLGLAAQLATQQQQQQQQQQAEEGGQPANS